MGKTEKREEMWKAIKTNSLEFYRAIRPTESCDTPTIAEAVEVLGTRKAEALVALAVNELVGYFNVYRNMTADQIAITAEMIVSGYSKLTIADIKACFRRAMAEAKIYDHVSGNMVMGWVADYAAGWNRKRKASEMPQTQNGVSFEEYINSQMALANGGNADAKEYVRVAVEVLGYDPQSRRFTTKISKN